jgi:hypothetical protein
MADDKVLGGKFGNLSLDTLKDLGRDGKIEVVDMAESPEERTPVPQDIESIITIDTQISGLLKEVGLQEEQILNMARKKVGVLDQIAIQRKKLEELLHSSAEKAGIDTSPDSGSKWTLDLSKRKWIKKL